MFKIIINKNSKIIVLLSIMYFASLQYAYVNIEGTVFSYAGFTVTFNGARYVVGWILYVIGILLFYSFHERMSSLFFYIIFNLSIAPVIVLFQYDEKVKLWMIVYQFLMLFIIRVAHYMFIKTTRVARAEKMKLVLSKKNGKIVLSVIAIFFVVMLAKYGIPSISSILLSNISTIRHEASFPLYITLMISLVCRILNPIFISLQIDEKSWGKMIYLIMVQVYFYAITGFKTLLFIPIVIVLIKYCRFESFNRIILLGLLVAVVGTVVLYDVTQITMIPALITNRVIFIPARIKYAFFEYFADNSFVYFSQSSIARIFGITSNYDMPIVYLIGEKYFNDVNSWANTGFLADAYAQMGYVGGAIISVLMAIELFWIDKVTCFRNNTVGTALFLLYFINLNDGALISVSVSGGMIAAIIFFGLINRRKNETDSIFSGKIDSVQLAE